MHPDASRGALLRRPHCHRRRCAYRGAGVALVVLAIGATGGRASGGTAPPPLTLPPLPEAALELGGEVVFSMPSADPSQHTRLLIRFTRRTATKLLKAYLAGKPFAELPFPDSVRALNVSHGAQQLTPLYDPVLTGRKQVRAMLKAFPERTARTPRGRRPQLGKLPRLADVFVLQLALSADIDAAARDYAADATVVYAEPNRDAYVAFFPDDPQCSAAPTDTWGLFKVNAPCAWDAATGANVTVAVIDTGLDTTHPDWQGATIVAPYDFTDATPLVPDDLHGHGTHVAGTIAAVTNNAAGVCSLAFGAKIMPVRGLDAYGRGQIGSLAQALFWATMNGADVINNSWGGGGSSPLIKDVIDFAHAVGVVVVSAAGNSNAETCKSFPANVETGLAVAAFNSSDAKASFSNFGVKVDVAAPGVDVLSTLPLGPINLPCSSPGGGYCRLSGTSMASPHVAALAALLIEEYPTWTNEQIRAALRRSAVDVSTAGFDLNSGYGRIDACASVAAASPPPAALLTEPVNCTVVSGTVPLVGLSNFGTGYTVEVGPGALPGTFTPIGGGTATASIATLMDWDSTTVPDGPVVLRLRTSGAGESEDRNLVFVDNMQIGWPAKGSLDACRRLGGPGDTVADIPGQINCVGLISYAIEYGDGLAPSAFSGIAPQAVFTAQPSAGVLGTWDVSTVPEGLYTLRVTATCSAGQSVESVPVVIDKKRMPGWPAAVGITPYAPKRMGRKSPVIVDLEPDGQNELVVGSAVFNPDGTVKAGWTSFTGQGRTNPAIVDIDTPPDGTLEVVAAEYHWLGCCIDDAVEQGAPLVVARAPDGTPRWSHALDNSATGAGYNHGIPSSVAAADVDGDGEIELVLSVYFTYGNPAQQTTILVLSADDGTIESSFTVADNTTASAIALADLDDDAAADLIVSARPATGGCSLAAYRWDGTPLPGWSPPVQLPCWYEAADPVVADVDRDGHYEILTGPSVWNHDGTIASGWPLPVGSTGWWRSGGALAELGDGDPELEVVVAGGYNSQVFWAVEHDAATKFFKLETFSEVTSLIAWPDPLTPGNVIIADIDGDGAVEVMRPAPRALVSTESWFKSAGCPPRAIYASNHLDPSTPSGMPRFVDESDFQIASTPTVGDLDGDGLTDLAVHAGSQVFVWSLGTPFNASANPWPKFQRDLANTGTVPFCTALSASGQLTPFTANKNDGIAGAVPVPDDGTVQAGAPLAFVDNGDGTISDLNTGLMWEKKGDNGGLHDKDNAYVWSGDGTQETIWDWLDTVNTQGGTGFAGYNDWRIPNHKELGSIIDYSEINPAVAPIFHSGCVPGCTFASCSCTAFGPGLQEHWTSTTSVTSGLVAWLREFSWGGTVTVLKTTPYRVRAVRGTPRLPVTGQTVSHAADKNDGVPGPVPVPDDGALQLGRPFRFTDNGDGTITDETTCLVWEKKGDAGGLHDKDIRYLWSGNGTQETIWDWLDDVNAEGGTGLAGYGDWRIPNQRELDSIIDYGTISTRINTVQPEFDDACTPSCSPLVCSCTESQYWSSTTHPMITTAAWSMPFWFGSTGLTNKDAPFVYIRAVRGGP